MVRPVFAARAPNSILIKSNCMLRPFSSSAPAAAAHTFDIEAESQRMEMKFQMESMCATCTLHSFVLPPYLVNYGWFYMHLSRSKLMNGIAKMCARKCIYKHDDSELEVAEMACADRCVTKFLQAQNQVAQSCYSLPSISF